MRERVGREGCFFFLSLMGHLDCQLDRVQTPRRLVKPTFGGVCEGFPERIK
jgi:hypothetical protein